MASTKKTQKHLPPRMRFAFNAYYYVYRDKWTHIGTEFAGALLEWQKLEGHLEASKDMALGQLLDAALLAKSGALAPKTLHDYTRAVAMLKDYFASALPRDIKPQHIRQYLDGRETPDGRSAPIVANREIAWLSASWEYARGQGWTDLPNPCAGVRRNRKVKRKRIATPGEALALITPQPGDSPHARRLALMAKLAFMTGMREGDMLNLTTFAISPQGLYVQPQKTSTTTGVAQSFARGEDGGEFDRLLIDILALPRAGSKVLFPVLRREGRGQPYETKTFVTAWRRYFASRGVVGLTWHDLRRSAGNAVNREYGLEATQDLLGHASVTTTEGYMENVSANHVAAVPMSAVLSTRVVPAASRQNNGLKKRKVA